MNLNIKHTVRFFQLLAMSLLVTLTVQAQNKEVKLLYKKQLVKEKPVIFLTHTDTTTVYAFNKVSPVVFERSITQSQESYKMIINKEESKTYIQSIDGQALASFANNSSAKFDVVIAGGKVYDWVKINGREWKYMVDGKLVILCSYKKEEGKKYIVYKINDEQAEGLPLVLLASHDYGIDRIRKIASRPFVFGSIVALVIFRAAIESERTPSNP